MPAVVRFGMPLSFLLWLRMAPRPHEPSHRAHAILLLVLLMGCGGKAERGTDPPPPIPVVAEVRVDPPSRDLFVGQQVTLTATPVTSAGQPVAGASVAWTSDAPAVASVSGAGAVTALAPGTATVTATAGGVSGSARITVRSVPVSSLRMSSSAVTLELQRSATLSATPLDSAGGTLAGRAVTWAVSDPSIASVSTTGSIAALAVGTTQVTASVEGVTGRTAVTVVPRAVVRVEVQPDSSTVEPGATVQLSATPRDSGGAPLTGRPVTWATSAPAVASVSTTGLVTALAVGRAQVTATIEGHAAQAVVVVPPRAAILEISSGATVARPGLVLTPPLRVVARGTNGEVALTFSAPVTVTQASGPALGLIGTLSATPKGGTATFDDVGFSTAGTYRLRFTAPGTTEVLSDPITVANPQLGAIASTAQSASVLASGDLRLDQSLELRDNLGARSAYSGVVRAAVTRGTARVVSGDSVVAINGVARFPSLVVRTSSEFTVSFESPGFLPYQRTLSFSGNLGRIVPRLLTASDSVVAPGAIIRLNLLVSAPSVVGSARYDVQWNPARLKLRSDSTVAAGVSVVINRAQVGDGLLSASLVSTAGLASGATLQQLAFELLPGPADQHVVTITSLEVRDLAGASLTGGTGLISTLTFRSLP